MLLKDQITAAIGAHGMWKSRLTTAISSGKCDCDVAKAGRDDQCDFGKWLQSGIDAAAKASPHYAKVKALHESFHKEAAKVLRLALAGQKGPAEQAMQGDYMRISRELVQLLGEWKAK